MDFSGIIRYCGVDIDRYIQRSFGELDPDYTLKKTALTNLNRGRCPFNEEMLSDNKYAHVGKYSVDDKSVALGLGLAGVSIQNDFFIEGWYIRISDSFYVSQLAESMKLKKWNIFFWIIAILSLISQGIIFGFSELDEIIIIPVASFFGSIIPIFILSESKKGKAKKLSKQIVDRTTYFPHHGIPTLAYGNLATLIETEDIEAYVRMNSGRIGT